MADPVVDTLSAQEFRREILDRITVPELAAIADALERKSSAMRDLLAGGVPPDEAALTALLRLTFTTRRKAAAILAAVGTGPLAAAITGLLDHGQDLAARFDRFAAVLAGSPAPGFDLPAELLHFTYPDRYWLWTRWIWDPETQTGSLGLVTTDQTVPSLSAGLSEGQAGGLSAGGSLGDIYLSIGRATAFVNETGKAAGFTDAAPGLFGTDIFLAAVYGVYMYTVLRMRMTREFNELVPKLPDLMRRLLGIYYLEASDAHRRA
jgi:hypothetical protein